MKPQHHTNIDAPLAKANWERKAGFSSRFSRLLFVLTFFTFMAAAEYLFMSWITISRGSICLVESTGKRNFLFSIKGLETSKVAGAQKICLKIGSVMVAPRKFFVFSIQPLNEALFEDFSVTYFRRSDNQSILPLSNIQQMLVPAGGEGLVSSSPFCAGNEVITRGVIRRFTLTVYDGDELKTIVKSEGAELDFKNNKIRLENAVIEQHDFKRIIQSNEAILKSSDGTLNIPGRYAILHQEGVLKGSGVKIKL